MIEWLEAAQWDGKSLQVDLRNHSLETPLGPSTSSPVRSRPIIPPVINRTGSIDSTYSHSYQSLETVSSPSYATSPTSSVYATPASPQQYSYQTPVSRQSSPYTNILVDQRRRYRCMHQYSRCNMPQLRGSTRLWCHLHMHYLRLQHIPFLRHQ